MRLLRKVVVVLLMLVAGNATAEACKPLSQRISEGVNLVCVEEVTHLSTSGVNLYLEIDNATCHRLVISEAEVDVVAKGEVLATISLRDKVVVRGRRTSTILVPLRFKARSSFVFVRLLQRALEPDSDITLNYRIKGGTALFRRRFKAEGVAIEELLRVSQFSANALGELEAMLR